MCLSPPGVMTLLSPRPCLWVWFSLSTESHHDLSLWELALSATQFVLLIPALGALREPASSDACASER
jgi:hypothetical protein